MSVDVDLAVDAVGFEHEREFLRSIDSKDQPLPSAWRPAARIDPSEAASIYRRNFELGVKTNLENNFGVAAAYLGSKKFATAVTEFLASTRPSEPVFTLFAAQFPGFLIAAETGPNTAALNAAGLLSAIDFFQGHVFEAGQSMEADRAVCRIWLKLRALLDSKASIAARGMYRKVEFSPHKLLHEAGENTIRLQAYWQDGELVFRIDDR